VPRTGNSRNPNKIRRGVQMGQNLDRHVRSKQLNEIHLVFLFRHFQKSKSDSKQNSYGQSSIPPHKTETAKIGYLKRKKSSSHQHYTENQLALKECKEHSTYQVEIIFFINNHGPYQD